MVSVTGQSLMMSECLRFFQDIDTTTLLQPQLNITACLRWTFLVTTHGPVSIHMTYLRNTQTTPLLRMTGHPTKYGLFTMLSAALFLTLLATSQTVNTLVAKICIRILHHPEVLGNVEKPANKCVVWK